MKVNQIKSPTIDQITPGFPCPHFRSPWDPSWPPLVHPQGRSQGDAPEKEGAENADAPPAAAEERQQTPGPRWTKGAGSNYKNIANRDGK